MYAAPQLALYLRPARRRTPANFPGLTLVVTRVPGCTTKRSIAPLKLDH